MNQTAKKYIKRTIAAVVGLVLLVAIGLIVTYGYLYVYAAFTWQCNIYTGEKTVEAQKVCDDFNSGGLIKVLTN